MKTFLNSEAQKPPSILVLHISVVFYNRDKYIEEG